VPQSLVQRVASIADEVVIFDPADQQRELTENTWSIGASDEELQDTPASEVVEAVRAVLAARRRMAVDASVDQPTTFYVWHDEQAGQLRMSTASYAPTQLPFGADLRLAALDVVVYDWVHAGSGLVRWSELDVVDAGVPEPPEFVLPVFAARLEPWALQEQHEWWKRRGGREMREMLLTLWDPIGVFDAEEAQDEYDSYSGRLSRLLSEGADKEQLTATLGIFREHMGLGPSEADAWVAEHLLAWHPKSTGREPLDASVSWDVSEVRAVRTAEELDELLDELHQQYVQNPSRVSIQHSGGATLSVGLGRDVSVLDYIGPAPEWPPYYISRGDLTPADEEVDWMYCEQHTPCLCGDLVPLEVAREAARVFFESGRLARAVSWEQV
jgi:hypothetical protein